MAQLDWVQILFDEIRDEDQAIEKKHSIIHEIVNVASNRISFAWIVTNICKQGYRESRKID